jgi:hypothetical protein
MSREGILPFLAFLNRQSEAIPHLEIGHSLLDILRLGYLQGVPAVFTESGVRVMTFN